MFSSVCGGSTIANLTVSCGRASLGEQQDGKRSRSSTWLSSFLSRPLLLGSDGCRPIWCDEGAEFGLKSSPHVPPDTQIGFRY
jgi:hypothetical protein